MNLECKLAGYISLRFQVKNIKPSMHEWMVLGLNTTFKYLMHNRHNTVFFLFIFFSLLNGHWLETLI